MPDGDFILISNPDDTHDDISLSQHDEEEAQVPVPKTWRSLFAKNRSKVDNLNFWGFAGQQVVKLDVEDVKEEQQRWQHALVGSVLGPSPVIQGSVRAGYIDSGFLLLSVPGFRILGLWI